MVQKRLELRLLTHESFLVTFNFNVRIPADSVLINCFLPMKNPIFYLVKYLLFR